MFLSVELREGAAFKALAGIHSIQGKFCHLVFEERNGVCS